MSSHIKTFFLDVQEMLRIPTFKLSNIGKLGLLSSLVQAMIVMALEIAISVLFSNIANIEESAREGSGRSIFVYLFIFIISQVFQFYLIIDALLNQNTIQIFTHVIFNVCMFAFGIFQIFQIQEAIVDNLQKPEVYAVIKPLLIATIIVLGVFSIISLYISTIIYKEFGWKIYRKIGADPRKRSMFRSYQILVMLLKLDLYFFLAFAIQFLALVLPPGNYEIPPTIIAIIVSPFVVIVVVYAVKRENRILILVWLVFLFIVIAYFIFKIVRIYQPEEAFKYIGSGKFLTLFAAISLLSFTLTLANTFVCYTNFDKGLKEHLIDQREMDKEADQPSNEKRKMELA